MAGVDDEWALVAREAHRERLVSALAELARASRRSDHRPAMGSPGVRA